MSYSIEECKTWYPGTKPQMDCSRPVQNVQLIYATAKMLVTGLHQLLSKAHHWIIRK